MDSWGFLAVFSAAVALRHTELRMGGLNKNESEDSKANIDGRQQKLKHVHERSLVFNEHLERLSEIVLVLLIGGSLFWNSWSWRAVGFAAFLFFVARPVSVHLGLLRSRAPMRMRNLIGWFGVRGIGSMYYLMYAIQHGLPEDIALELMHLVLVVVALSILIHGISVKPAIARYWRSR